MVDFAVPGCENLVQRVLPLFSDIVPPAFASIRIGGRSRLKISVDVTHAQFPLPVRAPAQFQISELRRGVEQCEQLLIPAILRRVALHLGVRLAAGEKVQHDVLALGAVYLQQQVMSRAWEARPQLTLPAFKMLAQAGGVTAAPRAFLIASA